VEDSTRVMEGLRRKHAESRSLVSGKARDTLFGLELRVQEMCGTRHRSGMTDGSAVGPEVVWVSYPVDLGQDSGFSAR
jgi:hypothetical protein